MGARLVVPIVVVALIFAASAAALAWHESQQRSHDNAVLIARIQRSEIRQAAERRESRARFKRTDVLNCREIEKLKAGFRDQAVSDFRNLDRNLSLLNLPNTPQIKTLARERLRDTLHRYAAREGGCGTLPSVRP